MARTATTTPAVTTEAPPAVRLINEAVQHPLVLEYCRKHGFKVRATASDYALAQFLEITSQAISNWRNSGRGMSFARVLEICERLNMSDSQTIYWLAEFELERAKDAAQKARLTAWKKRLTTQLSAVVLPFLVWLPTDVEALPAQAEQTVGAASSKYYVKWLRAWLRRRLARFVRPLLERAPRPVLTEAAA